MSPFDAKLEVFSPRANCEWMIDELADSAIMTLSLLFISGNLRDIPVERLLLDESLQIRPLNSVYVDELERFMSEGLWDWKKMVFTVFTRSFKMCGRTHLKYVVVDGNHRLRALLRFKLHDSGRTVSAFSIICFIYVYLSVAFLFFFAQVWRLIAVIILQL